MFNLDDLDSKLEVDYQAKALQLQIKAEEAKHQAEKLAIESSLVVPTFQVEFSAYKAVIKKLQNYQADHLRDHADLLNYFLTSDAYQTMHNEILKQQFADLLNALEKLVDVMPPSDSLLYAPLNQVLLNTILLTKDFVKSDPNYDAYKNKPKLNALTSAIDKSVIFVKNANEENRLALSNATDEMMQQVAPGRVSEVERLLLAVAGALLVLTAIALFVISVKIVASLFFVLTMCSMPFPLAGGIAILGCAAMGDTHRESVTNNIKKPLKQITNPGFFNQIPKAQIHTITELKESKNHTM